MSGLRGFETGLSNQADLEELGITEDLVTGEAVVLDLRPASFLTRALAIMLDWLILGALAVGLLWLFATVFVVTWAIDEAAASAVGLVLVVGLLLGVPVAVETATRGRSVGKIAAGLRVVRDDGGPIRFRQALIRGLVGLAEILAASGSVALIASLSNVRGKRLGDMLAGTFVVRERSVRDLPPPVPMPPHLAGWAAGTDLARVPDRLAVATRQFLARAARLNPGSRRRLGEGLAESLTPYVAPGPPVGTTTEDFLAAVLAERRRRDLDRLSREAAAREARERRRGAASPLSDVGTSLVGGE